MPPKLAQDLDCRQFTQLSWGTCCIDGGKQLHPISTNGLSQRFAGSFSLGETIFLCPWSIAIEPLRCNLGQQPIRGDLSESIQGRAQCFCHTFEPVEGAD